MDVEKTPFLVERLKIQMLPCVISFINGVSVDRYVKHMLVDVIHCTAAQTFQFCTFRNNILIILTPPPSLQID